MITRDDLLVEQASLEQQQSAARTALEKAKNDLEAIGGAMQMVAHLLAKLAGAEAPKEEKT